jgi:hypothetical protein
MDGCIPADPLLLTRRHVKSCSAKKNGTSEEPGTIKVNAGNRSWELSHESLGSDS